MNELVFLHKQYRKPGFEILNSVLKPLYTDIAYVHLKDATFVICEKNQRIFEETGNPTQHAWVEGTLVDALPEKLRLTDAQLRLLDTGIPIEYNPLKNQKGFTIIHSGKLVESAKEVVAYRGRLKAIL